MTRPAGSQRPEPKSQMVSVGGHRLKLTNLDKVMYPSTGTTKAGVLDYYARVADVFIRYAHDRPATRKRWVNGVGIAAKPGAVFFQKDLDDSTPEWVERRTIEHKDHSNEYPIVNNAATLAWLAQIAALEIHVPQWQFDRSGNPENPDRMVLDLDPGEGVGLAECAVVALAAREILGDMGLPAFPVTSGSKGIHLYATLDGKHTSQQVSEVAHELARALEADHPDLVVSDMKRALRPGKVFVDWSQNSASKTTVAPYSLRGRLRPTVAAPRTWKEMESPKLAHLEFDEVLRRVEKGTDPLADLVQNDEQADARKNDTEGLKLATYFAKRDPNKTPEPMSSTEKSGKRSVARAAQGNSFVIQEHHASRLHYDFRLERDGVLVSWALPKGVPTSTTSNHLAVPTEDHPLDYGRFEGSIPAGEYGAGTVSIWDAGHFELEKWKDDEVIVTLFGREGGGLKHPTRVALIRTGGNEEKKPTWLIHLMKPKLKPKPNPGERTASTTDSARPAPKTTRTEFVDPMLATLGAESSVTNEDEWAFEMKWDGIRIVAVVEEMRPTKRGQKAERVARLFTRNARDVTSTYPEIAHELSHRTRAVPTIFDGEVVALNRKGRPDFGLLQQRMGLTRVRDVEKAVSATPVEYFLFDVLEIDGTPVVDEPYKKRRTRLEKAISSSKLVKVPPSFEGDLHAAIASSRELNLEGVIAKLLNDKYRPGKRSHGWIKIKHHKTQEVVIGGWHPGRGRRTATVGSLLLGIPSDEGLTYVGRVGTGFTEKELEKIRSQLNARERKTSPFVDVPRSDASDAHWVRPDLVGEVEFAEWTSTGRLRQSAWRGWRRDKSAGDVIRES